MPSADIAGDFASDASELDSDDDSSAIFTSRARREAVGPVTEFTTVREGCNTGAKPETLATRAIPTSNREERERMIESE